MGKWFLGTMGFSYADWVGVFYPDTLAQRNYLSYYSRFFNAVEIDSTFYGIPRLETVKRWRSVTSEGFRFCLKVPRIVTHEKGLAAAHLDMAEFVTVIRELGDKLGVVLVQLPPTFRADQFQTLDTFLAELPSDVRFAVEFRHPSWYQAATAEMLRKHKVCWTATEYPNVPRGVNLTTDFIYFRLIGQHGQFDQHDREQIDRSTNLKWWFQHLDQPKGNVDAIYGFFNNDYAGFGAGSCNRFKTYAGLPASDLQPPHQGRLF